MTTQEASDKWYKEQGEKYRERQARIKRKKPIFRTDGHKFIAMNEAAQDYIWTEKLLRASKNIHPEL